MTVRPPSPRRFRPLAPALATLVFCLAAPGRAGELPAFVAGALARFSPDVPAGWAYQVAVTRGNEDSLESFDPSRPAGEQWTLLRRNGRPPAAGDIARYRRYRETTNATSGARATFTRGDLDYAGARVLHEGAAGVTLACGFRPDAAEPLLAHLALELALTREPAAVLRATLRLVRPYSPVTGMRMEALEVITTFDPPSGAEPALPRTVVSRFRGRMLWFWTVDEVTRVRYSEFRRAGPAPATPDPAR